MKRLPVLWMLLVLIVAGCGRRERRELNDLEQSAADTIAFFSSLHEGQFPGARVTNVAQVFALMDLENAGRRHPYRFQQRFRNFGRYAGFTNSFYEKYVSVSPAIGVTNRTIRGELVMMSAAPFPDLDGQLNRVVIWRAGKQDYRIDRLTEERIHQVFQAAGVPIPRPTPMPPVAPPTGGDYEPAYPVTTRVRILFEDIAYHYGPGRFFWLPMMLICVSLVGAVLVFLFLWFSRRGRH